MKNKLSLTITSAIFLLLSACGMAVIPGSGKIVEETRDVHSFSQIVFSAPGELTIVQNGQEGLSIEADDNLLQYIQTRVQGDILFISVDPTEIEFYPSRPILYTLNVNTLTGVTLNGAGEIRSNELITPNLKIDLNGSGEILIGAVKSQFTTLDLDGSGEYRIDNLITDQFMISVSGSGNAKMEKAIAKSADLKITGSGDLVMADLLADTVIITMSGSGNSILSGIANHQTVSITGSGSYNAQALQSQVATVKILGSGGGKVWATDELDVLITGSGDVMYQGKPAIVQTVTGSGDITSVARK